MEGSKWALFWINEALNRSGVTTYTQALGMPGCLVASKVECCLRPFSGLGSALRTAELYKLCHFGVEVSLMLTSCWGAVRNPNQVLRVAVCLLMSPKSSFLCGCSSSCGCILLTSLCAKPSSMRAALAARFVTGLWRLPVTWRGIGVVIPPNMHVHDLQLLTAPTGITEETAYAFLLLCCLYLCCQLSRVSPKEKIQNAPRGSL